LHPLGNGVVDVRDEVVVAPFSSREREPLH
jgi:hypothetical protein